MSDDVSDHFPELMEMICDHKGGLDYWYSQCKPDSSRFKSVEQLINEGGRFYWLNGESWCDTALDSWRLVPGAGYIKDSGKP